MLLPLNGKSIALHIRIRWFFCVFGLVYFLESIGGFYMTSAVVFIEKQFQIPSKLSGTMVSAGDFAYIPVVIFTSYFGGKGNRAKWIGMGCILISIANLLVSSSNFLFPRTQFENDLSRVSAKFRAKVNDIVLEEFMNVSQNRDTESNVRVLAALPYAFCDKELNDIRSEQAHGECEANPESIGPFLMIFGGLLILGVGRTMPFSLGLPLMDDNVKKSNLPVYFAIMFFAKVLGPVVGLLIGGQLNKIYYNFNAPQGLTPKDPMWIGCWWLGFLIFGLLLFFPSLALYLFPSKSLDESNAKAVEMETLNGSEHGGEKNGKTTKAPKTLNLYDKHKREEDHLNATEEFKAFLGTMKSLLKLPIYVGSVLGRILDVLAFKGFFVFLSKYLELQFDMPQHKIQQYVALVGIVGFALGVAAGSFGMKKLKLQGRKAASWVAMCSVCAALLSFANGTVGCENVTTLIGKQGVSNHFDFKSCDLSCNCDNAPLYPVCDDLGNSFYSPCHAGCPIAGKEFNVYNLSEGYQEILFSDCKCAAASNGTVSRSKCTRPECASKFNLFFAFQAIGAFFGGMGVVPGMLIILRSVPPEHRSVSLGFNGFVVSLFATLPSPVFWGKIYDMSCLHWPTFCGDRTAACQLYDMDELRVRIHLIYGAIRVISLLSDVWVIYWAKGLKLTDEEKVARQEDEASPSERGSRKHSRKPTLPELEARALEEEALTKTL